MKLEDLYLDGFGHFHQRNIGPLTAPVTVICGPNEAGKSTLLAFIRTILFGFPRQFGNFYPPLAGGRHGGRITLVDGGGAAYTVERFSGGRGGVSIRTADGSSLDDDDVLGRLTGQASLDTFKSVFAFSLDELQSGGLLEEEGVKGYIYGAALGVPKLPDFTKTLEARKNEIFRARGRNQPVAQALDELQLLDKRLKEVEDNAAKYTSLAARRETIQRELEAAEASHNRLDARRLDVENRRKGWEDWVVLVDCESKLKELPRFEQFPEDPVPRLDNCEDRVRQAREDREAAASQLRQAEAAAAAEIADAGLLEDRDKVELVRRGRSSFDASVKDLPERKAELVDLDGELGGRLDALGPDWDEARLATFQMSSALRNEVDRWKQTLAAESDAVQQAQIGLDQDTRTLQDIQQEDLAEVMEQLGQAEKIVQAKIADMDILEDRDQIEQVRRGRSSFDASVRDLPERQAELRALEGDLDDRLRDLGNNWTEERLESFDTSLVVRNEVDRWKQQLADQRSEAQQARLRLEQDQRTRQDREEEEKEARQKLPAAPPSLDAAALEQHRAALRTARSRLHEYQQARQRHDTLRSQLNALTGGWEQTEKAGGLPSLALPLLLGLAGAILLVAGVFLGQEALLLGIIGGLVLLGVAAYLLARGRPAPAAGPNPLTGAVELQVAEAGTAEEAGRTLLLEASAILELPDNINDGTPDAAALDTAEACLDAIEKELAAWNEATGRVTEAARRLTLQEERVSQAMQEQEKADQLANDAQAEWRSWLRTRRLADSFMPDTMIDFLARVELARTKHEQVRQMRHRVAAIETDIDEYLEMVQPMANKYEVSLEARELGKPGEPRRHRQISPALIQRGADALIEKLDNVRSLVQQRDEADRRAAEYRRQLEQREQRRQDAEQHAAEATEERERTAKSLEDSQAEWRSWLRGQRLAKAFTPDTMIEFLARVEVARTKYEQVRQMRHRVAAIETDIDEYRELVQPLAVKYRVSPEAGNAPSSNSEESDGQRQISPALVQQRADALIEKLNYVHHLAQQREEAGKQAEEHRSQLELREQRWQEANQALNDLLSAGGAVDPEEFRRRIRLCEECRGLERQRDECLSRLQILSGPGDRLNAFQEALTQSDLTQLNEESARLSQQLADVDDTRNSLREERGGIETELNQLTGEEESSALRASRNILLEQLRDHAQEWSRLKLAELMLDKTRQKFERERQPSVIRHAQEFFSIVTGKRYERLYAPIGEQTITVIDQDGGSKQPPELSRGTREQLYLALRFGLIREFGEHTERLPVVVDEVLVNFDPQRAKRAAEAFAELSQTNQVLVFTCHPTTAETITGVVPKAQVINI